MGGPNALGCSYSLTMVFFYFEAKDRKPAWKKISLKKCPINCKSKCLQNLKKIWKLIWGVQGELPANPPNNQQK